MGRKQGGTGRQREQSGGDTSEKRPQRGGFAGSGNVRAKKHLGQHFLTDLNIARKISDSLGGGTTAIADKAMGDGPAEQPADSARPNCTSAGVAMGAARPSGANAGEAADNGSVVVNAATEPSAAVASKHLEGGTREEAGAARPSCANAGGRATALEVGPGMGVLTQFLLQRDDIELYAAEIDSESVAYLHEKFALLTPRLFEEDFLKMDLASRFPDGVSIIGNFPYNISSQIFFKVLENRDLVPEVVGMVQREVAVRIAEPPGSRDYGILSVLLQAWYDIEYLFTVNENVFVPPPKVKSAVIRLKRNETSQIACDEKLFVKVVKASFGQRRKMLKNSLKAVFGDFGGDDHPLFTTRAEQLSVADFVELTRWVSTRCFPAHGDLPLL